MPNTTKTTKNPNPINEREHHHGREGRKETAQQQQEQEQEHGRNKNTRRPNSMQRIIHTTINQTKKRNIVKYKTQIVGMFVVSSI